MDIPNSTAPIDKEITDIWILKRANTPKATILPRIVGIKITKIALRLLKKYAINKTNKTIVIATVSLTSFFARIAFSLATRAPPNKSNLTCLNFSISKDSI